MEFSGERYVPSLFGEMRLEHLHRYALSLACARGKDVLDVACGEGYGANILAQVAHSVIGVDISTTAIEHARTAYGSQGNLRFLSADCVSLPIEKSSVDLVVSFETIEHHDRHEEMLGAIKSVLRQDGMLIISSPNKAVYTDAMGQRNPFHVKELYYEEFDTLLRRHFSFVHQLGQRIAVGSFVFPLQEKAPAYSACSERKGNISLAVIPQDNPVYFIAACGNSAAVSRALDASVYLDLTNDLYALYMRELRRLKQLEVALSTKQ
jgi:O-antigen biosynthesis protein